MMFRHGFNVAMAKFAARVSYEDVAEAFAQAQRGARPATGFRQRARDFYAGMSPTLRGGAVGGLGGATLGAGLGGLEHALDTENEHEFTLGERVGVNAGIYGTLGAMSAAQLASLQPPRAASSKPAYSPADAMLDALRTKHPGVSDRDLLRALHPDRLGHAPPDVASLAEQAFKSVSGGRRS